MSQSTCGRWLLETEASSKNVTKVRNHYFCKPWWSWWYSISQLGSSRGQSTFCKSTFCKVLASADSWHFVVIMQHFDLNLALLKCCGRGRCPPLTPLLRQWDQVLSANKEQHNCRQGLRDEAISRTNNYRRPDQQLSGDVALGHKNFKNVRFVKGEEKMKQSACSGHQFLPTFVSPIRRKKQWKALIKRLISIFWASEWVNYNQL